MPPSIMTFRPTRSESEPKTTNRGVPTTKEAAITKLVVTKSTCSILLMNICA